MKQNNRTLKRAAPLAVAILIMAGAGISTARASESCPAIMEDSKFASAEQLRQMMRKVAGFGLRSTASDAHEGNIAWIESEMRKLPGVSVESDPYQLERWQPIPVEPNGVGRSLELAGSLTLSTGGNPMAVKVAGAIPYSLPTGTKGQLAPLVYIPSGTAITTANARGKIVIRDITKAPLPYLAIAALSYHLSPDILGLLFTAYDRPFMVTNAAVPNDLTAAGIAGAAGFISVFSVPREQVRGYWDPHMGTHFTVPGVYVGVDEGEALKKAAAKGGSASIGVLAERDTATTRNLIATLPGQSPERIILSTHTDGIGYVEENGDVALLALADYFSKLPLQCRPRTVQFEFGSAHMHMSKEGTNRFAQQVDKEYDTGSVAFALALEHFGTREILPVARADGGPGKTLQFTGKGEATSWFAGSDALVKLTVESVKRRKLDRNAVVRGFDLPSSKRVPANCSFGGIGTYFHGYLVPTVATISGPWSLWAPSFGESAIDFDRMRRQVLAAGDIMLGSNSLTRDAIGGQYLIDRKARAAGKPTCDEYLSLPPEQAPGASQP